MLMNEQLSFCESCSVDQTHHDQWFYLEFVECLTLFLGDFQRFPLMFNTSKIDITGVYCWGNGDDR